MIEIIIDGKVIVPLNGSCITFDDDGNLVDLNNPNNLSFDPSQGMPELDPIDELPDQE